MVIWFHCFIEKKESNICLIAGSIFLKKDFLGKMVARLLVQSFIEFVEFFNFEAIKTVFFKMPSRKRLSTKKSESR